ncbi:MAG: hypothetical protein VX498_12145 [Myxococcota bacterium]|nr:hypothetical protein [Myxococcota bacterium]
MRLLLSVAGVLGMSLMGCTVLDLSDNPEAYVDSVRYRRAILERDLRETSSDYALLRLESYGLPAAAWELLPERDLPSRPLRDEDLERFQSGLPPVWDPAEATALTPEELPSSEEEWVELGRRVFFDYPLRNDGVYGQLVRLESGLEDSGFLQDEDRWVGLRLFLDESGALAVGNTCAQCHSSEDPEGGISGRLSNRSMDIGAARLLVQGLTPGELPPELDSTAIADLDRLGAGRADVLSDGLFNPFAFPDMGGLGDLPLLQHNANWDHGGTASLAIRCETLFITANLGRSRIPRVLSWALASYFRSLEPPPPLRSGEEVPPAAAEGEELFEEIGCADCHVPPLYTSPEPVPVAVVGTDSTATDSSARGTGSYRVPSLRGVSAKAPYLHHGAVESLEDLLDPARLDEEPGHVFGTELGDEERAALIVFLETL